MSETSSVETNNKRGGTRSIASSQLTRQWAILRMIERRPYSVRELSEELRTSKSSIQRDLITLQEHFMIASTLVGVQKRVYRLERYSPPDCVTISPTELEVLARVAADCADRRSEILRSLHHKLRVAHELKSEADTARDDGPVETP